MLATIPAFHTPFLELETVNVQTIVMPRFPNIQLPHHNLLSTSRSDIPDVLPLKSIYRPWTSENPGVHQKPGLLQQQKKWVCFDIVKLLLL